MRQEEVEVDNLIKGEVTN
jgi:hypothetical protein